MNKYPQTDEWMQYAIRRTNQITGANTNYQLDTQRADIYYSHLDASLTPEQKELLEQYREYIQMREDEIVLAVYLAAFEDAMNMAGNVSLMSDLS